MAQVFLSYATEDTARVRTLADALGQAGFTVFWDRTILPGELWRHVIKRELEAAACVVVAWSEASIRSHWVVEEASIAKDRLVPVRLDPVLPPFGFSERQAADLVQWKGDTSHPMFQAVCLSISTRLGTPSRATPPSRASDGLRLALWRGVLATGIAGSVGIWALSRDRSSESATLAAAVATPTPPTLVVPPPHHEISGPPDQHTRRAYRETFSDDSAVSSKLWALGPMGDWFGKVEDGAYQLCNEARSEQSSYTAAFSYVEEPDAAVKPAGGTVMLTVWLGEGRGDHSMAGILFRASPDKSAYYALARSAGHRVTLLQLRDNLLKVLSTWKLSQPDDAHPIKLRVETNANECRLFAEDRRIHSIVEPARGDERNGAFALGKGCFYFDDASLELPAD